MDDDDDDDVDVDDKESLAEAPLDCAFGRLYLRAVSAFGASDSGFVSSAL